MGSSISTLIFQPMLLGVSIVLIIVALTYQTKTCDNGTAGCNTDPYGTEIFKINMGVSAAIVCAAVIINFISGLMV